MTDAAQAFLNRSTPTSAAKAEMKFDDPARLDWHNIPKAKRKGMQVKDMSPEQRKLCHNLLRAALSNAGYDKAVKIMALENNLREGEKNRQREPAPRSGSLLPHHLRQAGEDRALGVEL